MVRLLAPALLLLAVSARAQRPAPIKEREFPTETVKADDRNDTPAIVRLMIKPLKRGMMIRLPVVDTDPNRGVTAGVMPIWVIQEKGGERIQHIHAPSLTHNSNFGVTPTYRYYFYPSSNATVTARTSAGKYEREAMLQYEDGSLLGTKFDFYGRLQYSIDASRRFFGVGPLTPQSDESSYKEDFLMYKLALGHPVWPDSKVRARASSRMLAQKIRNGPLKGLPGIETKFGALVPEKRQQSHELGLAIEYDSRDHAVTMTRGQYAYFYAGRAPRDFGSSYDFSRYDFDYRHYYPWENKGMVTAVQARYQQVLGTAPFWLMSNMGGKYSLRAYGEGRYMDRGAGIVNLEQRIKVYEAKTAGVTTEIELAPFVGAGTVFNAPQEGRLDRMRPVVGGAVRAVARPQVVGSVDVGVGKEGVAVFMDINYSF